MEPNTETIIRTLVRLIVFKGYIIAKNLSIVTDKVARTDPVRTMCANPYLNPHNTKLIINYQFRSIPAKKESGMLC